MALLQSLKAPSLISKKLQQQVGNDNDNVMINPNAILSRRTTGTDDVAMDEGFDAAKPAFGAASAAELNTVTKGHRRIPIPHHSNVTSQAKLDGNLFTIGRAYEVASPDECQIKNSRTPNIRINTRYWGITKGAILFEHLRLDLK
ncbi:unnamed protein product [Absidia cylindrospora]